MNPSLALLEFDSIAHGIEAGDAMIKRAPLDVLRSGTIHPGKYVVLAGGATADVEEALAAARAIGTDALLGLVYLPDVHSTVVAAIGGAREDAGEALGVIETRTVTAAIEAADAAVKGAQIVLRELRLADGIGGKGYVLLGGPLAEVEAGVEIGLARIARSAGAIAHVVIAQLHGEMNRNLVAEPEFLLRVHGWRKER